MQNVTELNKTADNITRPGLTAPVAPAERKPAPGEMRRMERPQAMPQVMADPEMMEKVQKLAAQVKEGVQEANEKTSLLGRLGKGAWKAITSGAGIGVITAFGGTIAGAVLGGAAGNYLDSKIDTGIDTLKDAHNSALDNLDLGKEYNLSSNLQEVGMSKEWAAGFSKFTPVRTESLINSLETLREAAPNLTTTGAIGGAVAVGVPSAIGGTVGGALKGGTEGLLFADRIKEERAKAKIGEAVVEMSRMG